MSEVNVVPIEETPAPNYNQQHFFNQYKTLSDYVKTQQLQPKLEEIVLKALDDAWLWAREGFAVKVYQDEVMKSQQAKVVNVEDAKHDFSNADSSIPECKL